MDGDPKDLVPSNRTALKQLVEEQARQLRLLRAELHHVREQLQAASADRTRFIAAASHDLLQPLNAARLYTSALVERTEAHPLQPLAANIQASLLAVEEILSAVLDISRLDSGVARPAPATFPVADLLQKVLVEFTPAARQRGIRLRVSSSSAAVHTDWVMVGRILQNLVSNAVKYTPSGGSVLVGVRRRGGEVRLDVIDTGIGIAPAQQKLIFAEFTRLESGAKAARGLGLGLSIVQRLVDALGLRLVVESEPARGSRFSLFLPQADLPPDTGHQASSDSAHDTVSARVLCVDNELAILDGMTHLLTGWGCDVRAAPSLKFLVEKAVLEGWSPDLVLMDFHLEQASGLDAIEWLHQTVGAHVAAALVTADHSEGVRKLAAFRGIPILHKPVKPAALRALLASLALPPVT